MLCDYVLRCYCFSALTHSLTHSPTHPLTHSLTHSSLTHTTSSGPASRSHCRACKGVFPLPLSLNRHSPLPPSVLLLQPLWLTQRTNTSTHHCVPHRLIWRGCLPKRGRPTRCRWRWQRRANGGLVNYLLQPFVCFLCSTRWVLV
jgi:hypothetical protein